MLSRSPERWSRKSYTNPTAQNGVGLELDRDVGLGLCKAAAHLERPGAGSQYDLIVLVLGCRYPG